MTDVNGKIMDILGLARRAGKLIMGQDHVFAELKKLPEQEYNVLVKIVLEDKKYKEVAEELHISVNTVKTHLSRALKMLRRFNMIEILILFNL